MSNWWYLVDGAQKGPVTKHELAQLVKAGAVTRETYLWKEGMQEWLPAHVILKLRRQTPQQVQVVSNHPEAEDASPTVTLATPWRRYWARSLDLWWELVTVQCLLVILLPLFNLYIIDVSALLEKYPHLLSYFMLPIALLLDACMVFLAGNSPGKALLGLAVRTCTGERLQFSTLLLRNYELWQRGLACGVPFFNCWTMWYQRGLVKRGVPTTYDALTNCCVHSQANTAQRKIVLGCAYLVCLIVPALVASCWTEYQDYRATHSPSTYQWVNPITHSAASIHSRWKYSVEKNTEGVEYYAFNDTVRDMALVVLKEHAPDMTITDYLRGIGSSNQQLRFDHEGHYLQEHGQYLAWQSDGTIEGNPRYFMRMKIVKVNGNFWRVLTVFFSNSLRNDTSLQRLESAVWNTICG